MHEGFAGSAVLFQVLINSQLSGQRGAVTVSQSWLWLPPIPCATGSEMFHHERHLVSNRVFMEIDEELSG
jgi:hypothetical protein